MGVCCVFVSVHDARGGNCYGVGVFGAVVFIIKSLYDSKRVVCLFCLLLLFPPPPPFFPLFFWPFLSFPPIYY